MDWNDFDLDWDNNKNTTENEKNNIIINHHNKSCEELTLWQDYSNNNAFAARVTTAASDIVNTNNSCCQDTNSSCNSSPQFISSFEGNTLLERFSPTTATTSPLQIEKSKVTENNPCWDPVKFAEQLEQAPTAIQQEQKAVEDRLCSFVSKNKERKQSQLRLLHNYWTANAFSSAAKQSVSKSPRRIQDIVISLDDSDEDENSCKSICSTYSEEETEIKTATSSGTVTTATTSTATSTLVSISTTTDTSWPFSNILDSPCRWYGVTRKSRTYNHSIDSFNPPTYNSGISSETNNTSQTFSSVNLCTPPNISSLCEKMTANSRMMKINKVTEESSWQGSSSDSSNSTTDDDDDSQNEEDSTIESSAMDDSSSSSSDYMDENNHSSSLQDSNPDEDDDDDDDDDVQSFYDAASENLTPEDKSHNNIRNTYNNVVANAVVKTSSSAETTTAKPSHIEAITSGANKSTTTTTTTSKNTSLPSSNVPTNCNTVNSKSANISTSKDKDGSNIFKSIRSDFKAQSRETNENKLRQKHSGKAEKEHKYHSSAGTSTTKSSRTEPTVDDSTINNSKSKSDYNRVLRSSKSQDSIDFSTSTSSKNSNKTRTVINEPNSSVIDESVTTHNNNNNSVAPRKNDRLSQQKPTQPEGDGSNKNTTNSKKAANIVASVTTMFSGKRNASNNDIKNKKNASLAASYHGESAVRSNTITASSMRPQSPSLTYGGTYHSLYGLNCSRNVDIDTSLSKSVTKETKVHKKGRNSEVAESCHGQIERSSRRIENNSMPSATFNKNVTNSLFKSNRIRNVGTPDDLFYKSSHVIGSSKAEYTRHALESKDTKSEDKKDREKKATNKVSRSSSSKTARSQEDIVLDPINRQPRKSAIVTNPVSHNRRAPNRTLSSDGMEPIVSKNSRPVRSRRDDLGVSSMHGTSTVSRVRRSKRPSKDTSKSMNNSNDNSGANSRSEVTTSGHSGATVSKVADEPTISTTASTVTSIASASRKSSPRRGNVHRAMSTQNVKRPEEYMPSERRTSRPSGSRRDRSASTSTSHSQAEPATTNTNSEVTSVSKPKAADSTNNRRSTNQSQLFALQSGSTSNNKGSISQSEHGVGKERKINHNDELNASQSNRRNESRSRATSTTRNRSDSTCRTRDTSVSRTQGNSIDKGGSTDKSQVPNRQRDSSVSRRSSSRSRTTRRDSSLSRSRRDSQQHQIQQPANLLETEEERKRRAGIIGDVSDDEVDLDFDGGNRALHQNISAAQNTLTKSKSSTPVSAKTSSKSKPDSEIIRNSNSRCNRRSQSEDNAISSDRKRMISKPRRDLLLLLREQKDITETDLLDKENRRLLHFLLYEHKMEISLKNLHKAIKKEQETEPGATLSRRRLPLMMSDS